MAKRDENYETAKYILKSFRMLLDHLTLKVRVGGTKDAIEVMKAMTAKEVALKAFGYTTNDTGRLVKRTPKFIAERNRKGEEFLKTINSISQQEMGGKPYPRLNLEKLREKLEKLKEPPKQL